MFYLFVLIFLAILAIFFAISFALAYHLLVYRLPEKDHSRPILLIFIIGGAILIIFSIIAFLNINWDAIL